MNTSSDAGKCSVLIVEDDPVARDALTKLLTLLGYRVCAVAEGVESLDGQHCAVLDMNLPDGLGTHILQRIKDEKRPMRVAVVTAATDADLIEDSHQLGTELILKKPLEVRTLLQWLDRAR